MMKTIQEKISKYVELRTEIQKQWKMETEVMPIVVTTTAIVPHVTVKNVNELGGTVSELKNIQKAVILHTSSIVRKVIGEKWHADTVDLEFSFPLLYIGTGNERPELTE